MRKRGGADDGKLYAMKVVKKAEIVHGDTGKQVWIQISCTVLLILNRVVSCLIITMSNMDIYTLGGAHLGRKTRSGVGAKVSISGDATLCLPNR